MPVGFPNHCDNKAISLISSLKTGRIMAELSFLLTCQDRGKPFYLVEEHSFFRLFGWREHLETRKRIGFYLDNPKASYRMLTECGHSMIRVGRNLREP
jgi:hypothetical protein